VQLSVETPVAGFVVFSDTYYPGWRAYLEDGEEIDILCGNVLFRVLQVPAGSHDITLRYEPVSVLAGLGITLGALCLTAFALLYVLAGERRSARQPTTEAL
jgi:uncharacterized membrane protein YfhO